MVVVFSWPAGLGRDRDQSGSVCMDGGHGAARRGTQGHGGARRELYRVGGPCACLATWRSLSHEAVHIDSSIVKETAIVKGFWNRI